MGYGSALGWGKETTFGTGVAATEWIQFMSESIRASRPTASSGSIAKSRTVRYQNPGIIEINGDISVEADGVLLLNGLYFWNGQVTSAKFATINNLTATVAASGSLTDDEYFYKVAVILQRTADSKYFFCSESNEDSATTATTNNSVDLAWTLPSAPSGFTIYGVAIYRGTTTDEEVFLDIEVGAAVTTHTDDGTATAGTAVPPGDIYVHTFTPAAPVGGTHPLPSFSVTKCVDHASSSSSSERYVGCRMNDFNLTIGDPNSPVEVSFSLMGQTFELISDPSPSYPNVKPMMNWQSYITIDGTQNVLFEGGDISCTNNLEAVPWLAGNQYHRDFYPGVREISGNLTFGYENHDQFNKVVNGTDFALLMSVEGNPVLSTATITSPIACTAMNYAMDVHLPKCNYQEGGASISGLGDRLVDSMPFSVSLSVGDGYDMRVRLWNTTSGV